MPQTVLSVVVDVQPTSVELLRNRITALRAEEKSRKDDDAAPYDRIRSLVPMLHFMSMTVFTDAQYDPIWVLEANFDGEPVPFWASLETAIGPQLRDMLRCCKCPRDDGATLFEAVTKTGSSASLTPFLEAHTVQPAIQHQGHRGLDRARVIAEGKLFSAIQSELRDPGRYREIPASEIHGALRRTLLSKFSWLEQPEPARITFSENLADWRRMVLFGVSALLVLAIPGGALALFLEHFCGVFLTRSAFIMWAGGGGVGTIAGILVWLRRLESRDPSLDEPSIDEAAMRAMARREDFIAQNHMINIVHIKPGVLRAVLVRAGLHALGLYLRIFNHNGYLNSMRTIHFAHWSLVSNGGRLMFNSNFDGSWESYLDDFIEKAHAGLTFAWTHSVGFPPTRFLVLDGATNGRKFKAWGRHSMVESLFWFSAYKEYSVNQIERQARIANGLRKSALTYEEAVGWALDL